MSLALQVSLVTVQVSITVDSERRPSKAQRRNKVSSGLPALNGKPSLPRTLKCHSRAIVKFHSKAYLVSNQ